MKRTKQCPKCGSTDVIADAMVIDHDHHNMKTELMLATFRDPAAILFKGQQDTTVSAWICADCGFVELYADAPKNLKLT